MRACTILLALAMASGCSCSDDCAGIACEACPPAIQIDVQAPGSTEAPTVDGPIPLECNDRPGGWVCTATSAPVGTHVFEVTLGAESATVTLELEEGGDGCCSCPTVGGLGQVDFSDPTVDGGGLDAGATDGGHVDGGGADAGTTDSGTTDSGTTDSGTASCDPSVVEFPMGGTLEPDTLCDDVFACVPAAAVASVQTSTVFDCAGASGGGISCPAGEVLCAYADPGGPGELDETEVANICALTVHTPPPSRVVCRVYL